MEKDLIDSGKYFLHCDRPQGNTVTPIKERKGAQAIV